MRKPLLCGAAILAGLGLVRAGLVRAGLAQDAGPNAGGGRDVSLASDDVIAARQAGFDLMAGELIGIKAVIDAKTDVKPLVDPSKALASWGRAIPSLFPAGTEAGHHTHARAEIWSDRTGFQASSSGFVAAADKLAQLAEANDRDGYAAQYKLTTQACGGCHRAYRARD